MSYSYILVRNKDCIQPLPFDQDLLKYIIDKFQRRIGKPLRANQPAPSRAGRNKAFRVDLLPPYLMIYLPLVFLGNRESSRSSST